MTGSLHSQIKQVRQKVDFKILDSRFLFYNSGSFEKASVRILSIIRGNPTVPSGFGVMLDL